MKQSIRHVGLDVHAETIAVAVAELDGEVRSLGTIPSRPGSSVALCGRAQALTRDPSPRQLPTDQDHDGGPQARSANIRLINRRTRSLDHSLHCVGATGPGPRAGPGPG